jgi:hypothetical protein
MGRTQGRTLVRAHVSANEETDMKRPRRGEAFWQALVEEWRAAGIPLATFAKSRGVPPNTMAYWVKRVPRSAVRLVRVEPEPHAAGWGVEVEVLGGVVRVERGVPAAWVAELLRHAAG